ncbi:MAG: DegQ family serine endoprotease [Desulfuromusa sp.]|nr:DegQ family serine endoprotease [Desulfuromusa sp.]
MRFKTSHFAQVTVILITLSTIFFLCSSVVLAQEKGLENLKQTGQAFRSVAKKVSPAVVFIKVEKNISPQSPAEFYSPFDSPFGDDFFHRFFGEPPQSQTPRNPHQPQKHRREVGQGSGFLITSDGYIITNNHVVGDADNVQVQLLDGREYDATIIGTDPGSDLAVIKVDETDLPFLSLGDSEKLEVGDWVLAFGNPFGLSHTLTAGIVSAKGRSGIGLNDYEDFIQTDAAINPGNSGGPLVNLDGKVIGINSAIFTRSGGYMGIGFAIPINMAKKVRSQLIEHGEVRRGRLGIYIQDMNNDLAESFGLEEAEGILITQIIADSPADDAGLEQGDVILKLNGKKIDKVASFRNRVALTAPGTKVRLTFLREGKQKEIEATIGKLETDKKGSVLKSDMVPIIGLSLQKLTPELARRLGYENEKGVLIADVKSDSLADRAGLSRGNLILEINRQPITSIIQAKKLLQTKNRSTYLFLVRQGQITRYIAIKLSE